MKSQALAVKLLLPFLTLVSMAQQPSAPEPEAPVTTLHTNTRLVVLDVVVTNKQGVPVRNLSKSDFIIVEDGQQQPIATFEPPGQHAPPPVGDNARTPNDNNKPERINDTAITSSALTILVLEFCSKSQRLKPLTSFAHRFGMAKAMP